MGRFHKDKLTLPNGAGELFFAATAAPSETMGACRKDTQAGSTGRPVAPINPFVTLLEGILEPVTHVPGPTDRHVWWPLYGDDPRGG